MKKKTNDRNGDKVLEVRPIMTELEISAKEGCYFPESHYNRIIRKDMDIYGILEDGTKKLLLKFRKGVLPQSICKEAYNALESHAQHKNYNRGAAAGKLLSSKLPKYVGKITKKESFRVFYKTRDGRITKDNIGNMAMSNIAGYYDKPDRNLYNSNLSTYSNTKPHNKITITKKNKITGKRGLSGKKGLSGKRIKGKDVYGNPLCRTTQFTNEQVEKWANTVPLITEADNWFKKLVPDRYEIQLARANKTPQYRIGNTAYSTITLNYDWRTACHKDKGDFEEGFGNLLVLEKTKSGYPESRGFKGGYLGFPRWGIAVDVRQGDFLAMDVHEWHCNTEIKGTGRLSIVAYLRKGMIKCASK